MIRYTITAYLLRVCTHREQQSVRACARATTYPFVKLMEIAESVLTGHVRQTHARVVFKPQDFKFYNFTRAL